MTNTNTTYTVFARTGGQGHFKQMTAKEIVESLFPLEGADDLKGMIQNIIDAQDDIDENINYIEENIIGKDDDISIDNSLGQYVEYTIDKKYDAEVFLKDVYVELDDYVEYIQSIIDEDEKTANIEQAETQGRENAFKEVGNTFKGYQENINKNIDIAKANAEDTLHFVWQYVNRIWEDRESNLSSNNLKDIARVLKGYAQDVEDHATRIRELYGKAEVLRAVLKEVE